MTPIIETKDLTHIYGAGTPFQQTAVDAVNFSVMKGEFLGLIGHTGSGKSTLIQHLNGLLKPTSGQVLFKGADIWGEKKAIRDIRFRVGLVFQYPEYQLFEETVYKDIAFGPANMGLSEGEIDERVREAAHFAGLKEKYLERSPFELSGGQKRRAAIAGVIAMRPDVLILDEPTAGLDPAGRDDILRQVRRYHKERATTVILVTHSMEDIAKNADRIVVMEKADIRLQGTPEEVFSQAETLAGMDLGVPQVTAVFLKLRALGIDIPVSVFTVEQAVRVIKEKRRDLSC
ncbi:energy-coupling factor transporter ATPase [Oscillospiraceae bacterium OttesenSCG-928-F05]|nr:energy-coupling factor transporter ATPase [Oscillospiraceae bacterium OttesenSCG-928-F05]